MPGLRQKLNDVPKLEKKAHVMYTYTQLEAVFVTLLGPWSQSLKALSAIGTLISSFSVNASSELRVYTTCTFFQAERQTVPKFRRSVWREKR